ncbi:MAG: hypothetical protein ABI761_10175 [Saprospiraceae bacterium]
MKKSVAILLLIAYIISSNGISLNYFYCCGKLLTISLVAGDEGKNCTGKSMSGCCENKIVTFKLKADQKINSSPSFESPLHITSTCIIAFNQVKWEEISNSEIIHSFNDPPEGQLTHSQDFLCVFRI